MNANPGCIFLPGMNFQHRVADKDHVNARVQISRHRGKTHPELSGPRISGYRVVSPDGSSPRLSRFARCVFVVLQA